jgi:hypothetical protein
MKKMLQSLSSIAILACAIGAFAPFAGATEPAPPASAPAAVSPAPAPAPACGKCGDGYCAKQCGETATSCPKDCGTAY